ncbi:MAG: TolC family protein [Magnetococcales bacterium]|nr:TolC family protein [Magnetococcales bacterium]
MSKTMNARTGIGNWAMGLAIVLALGHVAPAHGQECRELVDGMLERHPRLGAVMRDVEVTRANVGRVRGGWFPEARTSGAMGQDLRKPQRGARETDLTVRTLTVSLNQLLWDFGKMNAEVAKAELGRMHAEWQLHAVRAEMLLDAASACINLPRHHRLQALAEQSVANIRHQTGLEESRVELGGGLLTDALQAKSQLAGAQARLARAKGGLNMAINRFRALFNREPGPPAELHDLPPPVDLLPATLEKVLEETFKSNPQIQLAKVNLSMGQMEKKRVIGGELSPRIGAVVEKNYKSNTDGIEGSQQELAARVEFSYPVNLGLSQFQALRGATEGIVALENRLHDTRTQVEEQARNGWESLRTLQENADFLDNQARIAAEFLRLAREERQHGARSLIDILSGETGLINAQSDALAAKADVLIAQFGLLRIMGVLEPDALRGGPRFVLPKVEEVAIAPAPPSPSSPPTREPAVEKKSAGKPPEVAEEPPEVAEEPPFEKYEVTLIRASRVRDKPAMRSKVVGMVDAGAVVTITRRSPEGGWLFVEDQGWVATKMTVRKGLQPPAQEKTRASAGNDGSQKAFEAYEVRLVTTARLRAQPDARSQTLKVMPVGARVKVVGSSENDEWLLLENRCWILGSLVKRLR